MSVKHHVRDRAFDQEWMTCVLLLLQPPLVTPQSDKRFGPSWGLTVKRNSGDRCPIFFKNFIRAREQMVITPVMEYVCPDANRCVLGSLTDGIRVELCLKFLNSEEIWQFHSPRRLQVMEKSGRTPPSTEHHAPLRTSVCRCLFQNWRLRTEQRKNIP